MKKTFEKKYQWELPIRTKEKNVYNTKIKSIPGQDSLSEAPQGNTQTSGDKTSRQHPLIWRTDPREDGTEPPPASLLHAETLEQALEVIGHVGHHQANEFIGVSFEAALGCVFAEVLFHAHCHLEEKKMM